VNWDRFLTTPKTMTKSVCFYFQLHQPYRLGKYTFFDIGLNNRYFDDQVNKAVLSRITENCYRPAGQMLLHLLRQYPGFFKVNLSITGVLLDQWKSWAPDVLALYQEIAKEEGVELLAETYYHSLAFFYDQDEFVRQVNLHEKAVQQYFGQKPKVLRNTELAINNAFFEKTESLHYTHTLSDAVDWYLEKHNPNIIYKTRSGASTVHIKNGELSDDLAFRFSNPASPDYPLTAQKTIDKIKQNKTGKLFNIFIDFETFGEHQKAEDGVFDYFHTLVARLSASDISCVLLSEKKAGKNAPVYDIPISISWADREKDLSAWIGNAMQKEAIQRLYALKEDVLRTNDEGLIHVWSLLQTSDHFYYMSTKGGNDGDVHQYFSPYASAYDAYVYYMNVLSDVELRVEEKLKG
jgi:alpha-amylase